MSTSVSSASKSIITSQEPFHPPLILLSYSRVIFHHFGVSNPATHLAQLPRSKLLPSVLYLDIETLSRIVQWTKSRSRYSLLSLSVSLSGLKAPDGDLLMQLVHISIRSQTSELSSGQSHFRLISFNIECPCDSWIATQLIPSFPFSIVFWNSLLVRNWFSFFIY